MQYILLIYIVLNTCFILEGRKEGILSVARNLRSGGMSVEAIAAATGLSIEEIEQLD